MGVCVGWVGRERRPCAEPTWSCKRVSRDAVQHGAAKKDAVVGGEAEQSTILPRG